jgi:hypothetical protein
MQNPCQTAGQRLVSYNLQDTKKETLFNAFHTAVLDKYVYYCKPSNTTNLFAEA